MPNYKFLLFETSKNNSPASISAAASATRT
jgi:hypothetical protein